MTSKIGNNFNFNPLPKSAKETATHRSGTTFTVFSKVNNESVNKTCQIKQEVLEVPANPSQPRPHPAKLADRIRAPIMFLLDALLQIDFFDYTLSRKSGHLIGDDILRKDPCLSRLQGGQHLRTAKMLVRDMEKFVDPQVEGEALAIAKQYLQSCKEEIPIVLSNLVRHPFLNKVVSLILGTNHVMNQMVGKYQRQIKGLEEGKSLLFPVSLKVPGGFHAITAAVMRTADDANGQPCFSLVIGNVGLGLDHHRQTQTPVFKKGRPGFLLPAPDIIKHYVYPYILEGITLNQITNETFLRDFIAQSTCAVDNDKEASQFYGFLQNYAQDKNNIHVIKHDTVGIDDHIINTKGRHWQKSGTCILKSPSAALKFILPTDVYKRLLFKYKLYNWMELDKARRGKSKKDPIIELLHEHAFEKLKARINKQAKIEQVTSEEIIKKYFTPQQEKAYANFSAISDEKLEKKLKKFNQVGYQILL